MGRFQMLSVENGQARGSRSSGGTGASYVTGSFGRLAGVRPHDLGEFEEDLTDARDHSAVMASLPVDAEERGRAEVVAGKATVDFGIVRFAIRTIVPSLVGPRETRCNGDVKGGPGAR